MRWKRKRLSDVADFCLGKMLDEKKNRGEALPYLANVNVRWGEFDLTDLRLMRFESDEMERYGLKYGDIVMCEGGEPGRCAIWKDSAPGMMIQKALHRIRPHDCLDHRFLFYSFLHLGKAGGFSPLCTGATIKHLPRQQLAKLDIAIPPLSTQQRIASTLTAYDDLIENNTRRITLLEQAARLLYEEWFVCLRFPGREHTKIVDGVPKGWKRVAATEVIDVNPRTPANGADTILYVPMSALSTTTMVASVADFEQRDHATGARFRNGDILLPGITPCLENGKTAFVDFLQDGEVACGSTEFIVLRGRAVPPTFVYCLARTYMFRENAIKSMVGASGRQRVQEECFADSYLLVPPHAIMQAFTDFADTACRQIRNCVLQNQKLKAARDLLLPRLMNGEMEA